MNDDREEKRCIVLTMHEYFVLLEIIMTNAHAGQRYIPIDKKTFMGMSLEWEDLPVFTEEYKTRW